MSEGGKKNQIPWRGILGGMMVGALIPVLIYFYFQVTHPNPYNVFYLFYAPLFMIFGGIIGLLIYVFRDSDQ